MKSKRLRNAFACTVLLASATAGATYNASIDTLLDLTGMTVQMQSMKDLVTESSGVHAARCDSIPTSNDLPGFSAESILFDITSIFERQNAVHIEAIFNWYRSPLAEKIRVAEKSTVEFTDLHNFQKTVIYKDDVRRALIEKIVNNTHTPEFVATLGTEVEYAGIVHSGCIEKAAVSGKPNREQILADFTRNDKELTAALLHTGIAEETAYYFRDLTTDELTRYANFTSTENARLFYRNLVSAVRASLTLAGDRTSIAQKNNQITNQYSSFDF